jgi:hypothetical protein
MPPPPLPPFPPLLRLPPQFTVAVTATSEMTNESARIPGFIIPPLRTNAPTSSNSELSDGHRRLFA